jgi:hypothetical protein
MPKTQKSSDPLNFPMIETAKYLPIKLLSERVFTAGSTVSPKLLKEYLEEF